LARCSTVSEGLVTLPACKEGVPQSDDWDMWQLSAESFEERMLVSPCRALVFHVEGAVAAGHGTHVSRTALERLKYITHTPNDGVCTQLLKTFLFSQWHQKRSVHRLSLLMYKR